MYPGALARTKDPAIRTSEPTTLRPLVAGTCVSTMAVYTYFLAYDLPGTMR